jgi:hypothetical protein
MMRFPFAANLLTTAPFAQGMQQFNPTRLGGFHAKPRGTGRESSGHQRLRDLRTRIPACKEAFAEGE